MNKCKWCGKEFEEHIYTLCCSEFCEECWFADTEAICHDKVECPYCKERFTVEYEDYHNIDNEEFECKYCGKSFLLTAEESIEYTAKAIREEIEENVREKLEGGTWHLH